MNTKALILLDSLCIHYHVEKSFFVNLSEIGLIDLQDVSDTLYIHEDQVLSIERMVRIYHELDVNPEGIDIIFNLLRKIDQQQHELTTLRSRLRRFEDEEH
jgi:hypothetical protein